MTFQQQLVEDVWREKYAQPGEQSLSHTYARVANGVYRNDPDLVAKKVAFDLMEAGCLLPAGRILAGAGTDKRVTLINCFVSPDIQDSLDTELEFSGLGIMDSLKVASLTQQMGGGIGMDFSTIRPRGALVRRTQSITHGVLPFMDMWHAMCNTIISAGSRRGAMMGTLSVSHPDIFEFIKAKQERGRLSNFNVSVLVTDDFMKALKHDQPWHLMFALPGETAKVYQTVSARELWDAIIGSTYVHAEPGVIFIDRVNEMNNLSYCEHIHCTNPCGEQPLPPNGDCNLGHVNLARMVQNPFDHNAKFDFNALVSATSCLVRFLDNVLDVSKFPTQEQEDEAMNKRRLGIGFTGLASAMQQLGLRYGSPASIEFAASVSRVMCNTAYATSAKLAEERGPFPLFSSQFEQGEFVKRLNPEIRELIGKHGIRNGVLMSIAPTGTTSIVAGNVSSGIEPVFDYAYSRRKLNPDGKTFNTYMSYDYGYYAYCERTGLDPASKVQLPPHFNTAHDLTVDEHLNMQAAVQEFIDASISKTINCPVEMTFEEFKSVYTKAYDLGLKGCTTYRPDPNSGRGAVLTSATTEPTVAPTPPMVSDCVPMADILEGRRYRVKWPQLQAAFYVVINDYVDAAGQRRPFEMLVTTKSAQHDEWMKAITLLVTAIFRREGDPSFIVDELKQVHSAAGGAWINKKYTGSIIAAIGRVIEEHLIWLGLLESSEPPAEKQSQIAPKEEVPLIQIAGGVCSKCMAPAVIRKEGCFVCGNCGDSSCG